MNGMRGSSRLWFPAIALFVMMATASLIFSPSARAQQPGSGKISLQLNCHVGSSWQFQWENESTGVNVMSKNGTPVQQTQSAFAQKRSGTVTVLALDRGVPTVVRITFDPGCGAVDQEPGKPPKDIPFVLAGQTVVIHHNLDGTITVDHQGNTQLDAATTSQLSGNVTPNPVYPANPIGVGDTWQVDKDALATALQLGDGDSATQKCTFDGVETINNRQTARVISQLEVHRNNGVSKNEMKMTGPTWFDIETGLPLQGEAAGQSVMTLLPKQYPGGPGAPPMTLSTTSTMQVKSTSALTILPDQSVDGQAPTPGAAPQGPGMMNPAQMNPMSPAPGGAPSYSGTFSNDKFTLQLQQQPDGSYSGTIQLGTSSFPARASMTATGLNGVFQSGGNNFGFQAQLQNNGDMLFVTSGTTYVLHASH
jgi:hypothetical protein